ncbi:hypothetical protein ACWD6P_09465 [Streptomyces sp. NPDC002446]
MPQIVPYRARTGPAVASRRHKWATALQPGASNLPEKRTEATEQQVQAARIWSGDEQTAREMSDDQLAAAEGSGLLDDRARGRIEAEADRRDLDALLARIAPGGTLAEDLTQFSDAELARTYQHLDDGDALRVIAEADRRDLATRLPGVAGTGRPVQPRPRRPRPWRRPGNACPARRRGQQARLARPSVSRRAPARRPHGRVRR